MHKITLLGFFFLLASPNANACFGASMENGFPSTWERDGDLIAMVSVTDENATKVIEMGVVATIGTITQVIETSDSRVQVGSKISMKYERDSCGPHFRKGDSRMIVARTGTDSEGQLVLYPYTQNSKGRIYAPFTRNSTKRTRVPEPDDLTKLNARCAAFYEGNLEARRQEGKPVPESSPKSIAHKLYAQRLNELIEADANPYEGIFSNAKAELAQARADKALDIRQMFEDCWLVEFHSSLVIKERQQKRNE